MAKTDAQKRAEANYRKKVRKYELKLTPVDQDMIEWMDAQDNKQGYIKELIRRDMDANIKQGD